MEELLKFVYDYRETIQPIISLLALLVGFTSILLAFITYKMNAKHLRLSVMPIADIISQDFEDYLCVKLENKGNGPLIIKAFRAFNNDKFLPNLIDWMPNLPDDMFWSDFHKNFENSALRPSDTLLLIAFKVDVKNNEQVKMRDSIRRVLSSIDVELDYTDMYDNPFKYDRRSLSWFARNLEE